MTKVKWIRKYAPGYIGGKEIAKKANDNEVKALSEFYDKVAEHSNAIQELEKMIKRIKNVILGR